MLAGTITGNADAEVLEQAEQPAGGFEFGQPVRAARCRLIVNAPQFNLKILIDVGRRPGILCREKAARVR